MITTAYFGNSSGTGRQTVSTAVSYSGSEASLETSLSSKTYLNNPDTREVQQQPAIQVCGAVSRNCQCRGKTYHVLHIKLKCSCALRMAATRRQRTAPLMHLSATLPWRLMDAWGADNPLRYSRNPGLRYPFSSAVPRMKTTAKVGV